MCQALAKRPRMSVDEFVEMIRPYPDEERVEAWQREDADWRSVVLKELGVTLALPELGGELRLTDVYDGISPLG